jgi:primosomal protein N' (replication factor Y)
MIKKCRQCGSTKLIESGAGTEKIEEELNSIFPKARIERMDSDTMVSKFKYQRVLTDFSKGDIDILVGTQIISKGLDFPNVTLVGVVNADIGMLLPDFRAEERTFQLLTQVAGRSGRSNKSGEVLIQTRHIDYNVFGNVCEHDYEKFYRYTIKSRSEANFPPFSRIALIEIKSKVFEECKHAASEIHTKLKQFMYSSYLDIGSAIQPLISKVKDQYRYHIIIKSSRKTDPSGKLLVEALRNVKSTVKISRDIRITFDIDTFNFM